MYCGYGLGEEVKTNNWNVTDLSNLRQLYTVPYNEMDSASIHTGLHYMTVKTNNGTMTAG